MVFLIFILQIVFIFIVIAFVYPFFTSGLGYAPSTKMGIERMIDLAGVKPGDKAVDIGSGDGRIVIALAQRGIEAHGYEINPALVWWSRYKIWKAGLRGKAFIHQQSFWKANFSEYSVIILFAVKYIMKGLEKKLTSDLRPGARVVTNYFTFPNWKPSQQQKGATLYIQGPM